MLEGGQVDMQAEEVQDDVGVDFSVDVVGKTNLMNQAHAEALPIFYSARKWKEIHREGRRSSVNQKKCSR